MTQTQVKPVLLIREPALETEEPRVWVQPPKPPFPRWNAKLGRLLGETQRSYRNGNHQRFNDGYQFLLKEFRGALTWVLDSWDYLVTTRKCRFILRSPHEQPYHRGDYRPFVKKDYQKLILGVFKERLLAHTQTAPERDFSRLLDSVLWQDTVDRYDSLRNPPDRRQRKLTSYSYLRCVPYRFFSPYHQELVDAVLDHLPGREREIIDLYFLSFYTTKAVAEETDLTGREVLNRKKDALVRIRSLDILTHALLLQIERY